MSINRTGLTLAALTLAISLGVMGCGEMDPAGRITHTVSGSVSYDGKPVDEGRIQFRNMSGDGRAYSGEIKGGQYSVKCEAGSMKVEIIASRVIPGKTVVAEGGEKVPAREMYIPTKYNSQSTLTAEVKSGSQTIPFDLAK